MTNQEQYDNMCDKARKYDRLVMMIVNIRNDIKKHREKTQYIDTYDLVGDCLDLINFNLRECEDLNNE